VSDAVQQMDELTQRNAANAEETASASEEMTSQSENLMDQVRILTKLIGGSGDEDVSTRKDAVGQARTRQSDADRARLSDGQGESTKKNVALANQHVNTGQTGRKGARKVKKLQSKQKTRLDTDDGNGDVIENASHKDADKTIPMDEEKVLEHDEKSRDF
jgi:hypothetical protein